MKKILFISLIPGNMEAMLEYYNLNIKDKKNYDIEMVELYKFYKKQLLGRIYKLKFLFKKYDLVITDYPTTLLNLGKSSIYMDHGSGLKVAPGKNEILNKKVKKVVKAIENSDYFIIQSPRECEILYSWVDYVDKNNFNFISLGQPRNDKLFNNVDIIKFRKEIFDKFKIPEENEIILLAPTWRGYEVDFNEFINSENLNKFNEFLHKNKITLIYRPHYLESIIKEEVLENIDNLVIIDNMTEKNTQKILSATDYLITDYSGILTEFLALNKPVMFLDIDTKIYEKIRGIAVEYYNDVHTPGPKIKNIEEVIDYVENIREGNDVYKKYRLESIKYYYKYYDGNSCKRVWELINSIL